MKFQLDSEGAVLAPAEIEGDFRPFVGDEWQNDELAPGDFEIPAAVGVGIPLGVSSAAREGFAGNADDVVVKIMERIAETPFKRAVRVARQIPFRRDGVVGIFQPPDGIYLVIEMNGRNVWGRGTSVQLYRIEY